jgi:copper chaperone
MTVATLQIDGMSCQHCVMRVKKAIEALSGVSEASVDVGVAKVTFDESKLQQKEHHIETFVSLRAVHARCVCVVKFHDLGCRRLVISYRARSSSAADQAYAPPSVPVSSSVPCRGYSTPSSCSPRALRRASRRSVRV